MDDLSAFQDGRLPAVAETAVRGETLATVTPSVETGVDPHGHLADWDHWYIAHRSCVPREPSEFARWARARISPAATVADLGCGLGRDSLYFAAHGHRVASYDGSAAARVGTTRALLDHGLPVEIGRLSVHEPATLVSAGAELMLAHGLVLYARQLLDAIDDAGRTNLWRLARSLGAPMFVEFASGPAGRPELVHPLDPELVVGEATAHGGWVVDRFDGLGTDLLDQPQSTTRLQLHFR